MVKLVILEGNESARPLLGQRWSINIPPQATLHAVVGDTYNY